MTVKSQSHSKKVFKRLLWTLLIIVGLHAGVTAVLKWKVNSRIEALRKAGEPIYAHDMIGPPIPDSQNGGVELTKVINILESKTLPANIADYIKGVKREKRDDKWWRETELELSSQEHIFKLIKICMNKPTIKFKDDYLDKSGFYEYDHRLAKIARIMRLKAICDARNRRMHKAAESIFGMMNISHKFLTKCSQSGSSRYSIFMFGGIGTIGGALRYGEFNIDDSKRLDNALAVIDLDKPTVNYLRERRSYNVDLLEQNLANGIGLSEEDNTVEAKMQAVFIEPIIRYMELCYFDYVEKALEECSKENSVNRNKLLLLGNQYKILEKYDQTIDSTYFERIDTGRTKINLARLLIKIKSYKRDNGVYPISLTKLCSNLPTDPVSGEQYNYERTYRGFKLYGTNHDNSIYPLPEKPTPEEKLRNEGMIGWIFDK